MEQGNVRITGFDALRFVMVVLVIMLHAAMTYMMFVPEWWYVIDDNKSFGMALLVVFLDSFPMSALFFLAGYFAPPSLAKRGTAQFLHDKFMRIGLPWIIGVLLVAPFFAYASYVKYGLGPVSTPAFMKNFFFGPFYQQGHYWFLGLLFFFLALYAVLQRDGGKTRGVAGVSPAASVTALWIASVVSYYLAAYLIKPAVEWVNIGYVIYFQHARVIGYAGFFALGVCAWRWGWFTPAGWKPNVTGWGVVGILSSAILLYWKFFVAPALSATQNDMLDALLYNTAMISMTFFLAGLFIKTGRLPGKAVKTLSTHSYPIYWLHQIVLMPFGYFLKPFDISVVIKWAVGCAFTLFGCYLLSAYFLKRAPFLRRIF
jgi:peptidoglycan/LPS O-acetylase OafA/YrhL